MIPHVIRIETGATMPQAQDFCKDGMERLDKLLIGETEAKLGLLVVMAAGVNGVIFGYPGGGKTTLARDSYRLIDGIDRNDVGKIPPLADLSPQAVGGGKTEVVRTVDGRRESIATLLTPILRGNTKVIYANEINREAPHAANAALEAYENHELETPSGTVELRNIEYSISTMNPGESRSGVFPIVSAMASRHAVGAVLGNGGGDITDTIEKILNGFEPEPGKIEPVITLAGLHDIREFIRNGHIGFPETLQKKTVDYIKKMQAALESNRHREAVPRLAKHVRINARTLAAFNSENAIGEKEIRAAIKFVVSGRLGMLAANAQDLIPQVVDDILAN